MSPWRSLRRSWTLTVVAASAMALGAVFAGPAAASSCQSSLNVNLTGASRGAQSGSQGVWHLTATVTDHCANPVGGVVVTFQGQSGATLSASQGTTDAAGQASVTATAPLASLSSSSPPTVMADVTFPDGTAGSGGTLTLASSAPPPTPSTPPPSPPSFVPFSDLGGATWAEPAIGLLSVQGVVHGYPNGTFGPDESLSTEAAITMLWHSFVPAGAASAAGPIPGVDSWAVPAVAWAEAHQVILHPDRFGGIARFPAPRDQVAAWVVRTLGLTGTAAPTFDDAAAIPSEYAAAVGIAQADGVVAGGPNGNFHPSEPVTRAQMAALLVSAERADALAGASSAPISWQPPAGSSVTILPLTGTVREGTVNLAGSAVEGGVVSLGNRVVSIQENFLQSGDTGEGNFTVTVTINPQQPAKNSGPLLWRGSSAGGSIWSWTTVSSPGSPPSSGLGLATYTRAAGVVSFQESTSSSGSSVSSTSSVSGAFQPSLQNGSETTLDCDGPSGPCSRQSGYLTGPALPLPVLVHVENAIQTSMILYFL